MQLFRLDLHKPIDSPGRGICPSYSPKALPRAPTASQQPHREAPRLLRALARQQRVFPKPSCSETLSGKLAGIQHFSAAFLFQASTYPDRTRRLSRPSLTLLLGPEASQQRIMPVSRNNPGDPIDLPWVHQSATLLIHMFRHVTDVGYVKSAGYPYKIFFAASFKFDHREVFLMASEA